jgi:hypothetical protein
LEFSIEFPFSPPNPFREYEPESKDNNLLSYIYSPLTKSKSSFVITRTSLSE